MTEHANFEPKLAVNEKRTHLQMEMQKNDHFAIARLVKCVFDVIIEDVNFVTTNAGVLETIDMSLQYPTQPFLSQIRPNVQIFQLGVAFSLIDDQPVLLDQISLLLLFGLTGLVLFLDILDQSERRV